MARKFVVTLALCLALAGLVQADGFTDENETPHEPFVSKKSELFRFSRSVAKGKLHIEQQRQQQVVDNNSEQVQAVENNNNNNNNNNDNGQQQQQQQVTTANESPVFGTAKTQVVESAPQQQPQQQQQQTPSSFSAESSSSKSSKNNAKTITTTRTTTTTTTHNFQDQPQQQQVAQLKEIHVHTVPLSRAVHYANYMVVPNSQAAAAHLEESSSSSSSSSHKSSTSSSSSSDEVESPTVIVNPVPVAAPVDPDCVLHRLIVERPVTSQLIVSAPAEVKVSRSSSSSSSTSHSARVLSEPQPAVTTYVRRVHHYYPAQIAVTSARVVAPAPAPSNNGHLKEEHFHTESRSSREHSLGGGLTSSSSSSSSSLSSSSSRKSTTTTTTTTSQQTAALLAPPVPVHAVTVVRQQPTIHVQAAPVVAIKSAPLIAEVATSGIKSNDVQVHVDQSGPNYKYGYSIKQHSSEPGTKGVVVGERVVYL